MSKSGKKGIMPFDCEEDLEKVTGGGDFGFPDPGRCSYFGDEGACQSCNLFNTPDCVEGYPTKTPIFKVY
jgi:hypothetical protein